MADYIEMSIKELAQHEFTFCAGEVAKGESIMAHLTAWDPENKIHVIAAVWNSTEDKQMFAKWAKLYFILNDIKRYLFTTEAWVIKLGKGDEDKIPTGSYEQDPRRAEQLMVIGFDGTDDIMLSGEIHRDGKIVHVDDAEAISEGGHFKGIFGGSMLPPAALMADPNAKVFAKLLLDSMGAMGVEGHDITDEVKADLKDDDAAK